MAPRSIQIKDWVNRHLPAGSPTRKVIEVFSIILVVEGLSVLFLFSYVGLPLGVVSLVIGSFLLLVLAERDASMSYDDVDTIGVRLVQRVFVLIGGEYTTMALGAGIIMTVFLYNQTFSSSPDFGDSDRLVVAFGFTVMLYSLAHERYRVEATFALVFVGLVVAILVVPQAIMAMSNDRESSSVGDWYVHYMLAAPFARILDVIGVPSSSTGNLVTVQFESGDYHTLSISAYCAGLYSFSIFLSAFISFVLVIEKLPRRALLLVLVLGLLVAYLGNLFRMVVIGVVGYHYGIDALHWTHENIGWIIFLSWSALFWYLIFRYAEKRIGNSLPFPESEP